MGGDLYTMKFPDVFAKKRTMLIGIDVCHEGAQSIVGFSASVNEQMTQYFSDHFIQKKGQELVTSNLRESIGKALQVFQKYHGNHPTNLIIYRDGVGEQMRDQVLQTEISQFTKAVKEIYNKASKAPEVTVIVVNKKVSQRFFVSDQQGKLSNPPSGCLIDKALVEKHTDAKQFDFYLTAVQ